jgi:2'-hydroxyisoflavone reductase
VEAALKILIIGGTRFLGRHLVDAALARGHAVSLFNRGKSNPELYSQNSLVENIRGDRENDLDKLAGRSWDAIIDTCGYFPRIVNLSAKALKDSAGQYVFISSISVYADFIQAGINESFPTGIINDEAMEEITGESYGPLKALCEKTVTTAFNERSLIIRPGLIVGPHDPTDRFTYWPVRMASGGDVLAPEGPQVPVQIIDARDLAGFVITLVEQKATGCYNATGPASELNLGRLLETCKDVSASDANIKWAPVTFLSAHKVAAWSDMPVWVPDSPEDAGFSRVDISKALAAGLTFRPLSETVHDTLAWAAARSPDYKWMAGLDSDREIELLELLNRGSH